MVTVVLKPLSGLSCCIFSFGLLLLLLGAIFCLVGKESSRAETVQFIDNLFMYINSFNLFADPAKLV